MGLIAIEGMHFYAHHGYYREEQVIGGQYKVDVYMTTDFSEAAMKDKLDMTINYEVVYALVKEVMKKDSHLIEHVAHEVINKISEKKFDISHIRVRVAKLNPPLKGTVTKVFVELDRQLK